MRRLALLAATSLAGAAWAEGPIGPREEFLLAQPRLTLPATSPAPLPVGETELRLSLDWGNDFGWDQDVSGELPGDRRYLVDGEHATLGVTARRGIAPGLDLTLRVPLHWRGGGVLDRVIDWWHGVVGRLGVPDNGRAEFATDRFRVMGRTEAGDPLAWSRAGSGLGRVEIALRRGLGSGAGERAAVIGRIALPTATGSLRGSGAGVGIQLVGARPLGRSWRLLAGTGGTLESEREIEGIRYERARLHGFLAAEWKLSGRLSLLAETSAASRLVTNLAGYPGLQWYLNLGARLQLGSRHSIEASFSENVAHQQSTTDFALQLGLVRRFRD